MLRGAPSSKLSLLRTQGCLYRVYEYEDLYARDFLQRVELAPLNNSFQVRSSTLIQILIASSTDCKRLIQVLPDATGPVDTASKAILLIYDIFGFSPQIIQGADILSGHGSETAHDYGVFMPDFFNGSPAPAHVYPDDTPEKKQELEAFLEGPGETKKTVERLFSIRHDLQKRYPQIKSWGLVGYCWGGWVSSFATTADTPFKACAQLHPGFVSTNEASKIVVPVLALASEDEPEEEWQPFKKGLLVPHHIEVFADMVHGWMSARGQLEDEKVKAAYSKGYQMVLNWFEQYL